ncbi:probable LRR receptor-like serine/threonine-protein kinase [Tanacetum coccineum]
MITTPIFILFTFPLFFSSIFALNSDGTSLLSLKHSQPKSSALKTWNKSDPTPCSWFGVTCAPKTGSVIGLSLPNANLIGSIPITFGHLQYLRFLDLSNNSINGTLPISIFRCLDLETVDLSFNSISGEVPEEIRSVGPTNAALAAIPKTGQAGKAKKNGGRDVKIAKIVAIVVEKVGASLCQLSFGSVKISKGMRRVLANTTSRTRHGNIKRRERAFDIRNGSHDFSDFGLELPNYQAPEAIKTEKPNAKWDVYSFGVILLELLLGKVLSNKELGQWNITGSSIIAHNEAKILKIVDGFATTDLDKKDSILTCIKLGFNCANMTPQKRPSMKEALQVLEKIPCQS